MFATSFSDGVLTLHSHSNTLKIWPEFGAILNSWEHSLPNGSLLQLIEGYDDALDISANLTAKGFRSCKLSPYVCRMRGGRYAFDGKEHKVSRFYLGESAIHGLVYNAMFHLESHFADAASANAKMVYRYQHDDSGYPFSYSLEVTYRLEQAHRLSIQTICTNHSLTNIPICDGWHPYFMLGAPVDNLYMEMDSQQMVVFDDGLLPTGAIAPYNAYHKLNSLEGVSLDNCFVVDGKKSAACRLVNPAMGLALSIEAVHGYPYLQVYTPPHRQSIAIENLSSAPDAFNNGMGLRVLPPTGQARFEAAYQLLRE
jgi:aldose 1-epimerase